MRIVVAVPCHDMVHAKFTHDLLRLHAYSVRRVSAEIEVGFKIGTYIHDAREQLATEALQHGATHILWLDADMRFPEDALQQLLGHDRGIVGVNYLTRHAPHRFVSKSFDGYRVATNPESRGLEEVAGLGFGLLLVRADVLLAMQEPRFRFEWSKERGAFVGEDFLFCARARELGFPSFIDHDLSKECAHIGNYEHRPQPATVNA